MNERRTIQLTGLTSTDSRANSELTSGIAQVVRYEQATPVQSTQPVNTEAVTVVNSRTVTTSRTAGTLKLRYTPRKLPPSSASTS